MSAPYLRNNKRRYTIANEFESRMVSLLKEKKEEEKILEEILDKKIPIGFNFFSKNFFFLMPRRCHSLMYLRRTIDLSDYDNEKLKFNEWIEYNKDIIQKIEKEILKLLVEIFEKRSKLYPNNMCGLSPRALKIKKSSTTFCSKFSELSTFILYILNKQLNSFYKCVDDKVDFKTLHISKLENIKEILYHTGKDIKKIFQSALDNTGNFKMSSVLIIKLEEYLIKCKIIEPKKTKNIPLLKEKEKFDNYIKNIQNMKFLKDYEVILNKKLCFEKEIENNNKEAIDINDDDYNNQKELNVNKIDNIFDNDNEKKESENNNNNVVQNLNIDDLMNYINEPKGKNNKKKKKKKKKGKRSAKLEEENEIDENNKEEEDLIFDDYKKSLKEFSESILDKKKIKHKISDNFIKVYCK
jgi:hypothetical protein